MLYFFVLTLKMLGTDKDSLQSYTEMRPSEDWSYQDIKILPNIKVLYSDDDN
jgi:hypothetical protein